MKTFIAIVATAGLTLAAHVPAQAGMAGIGAAQTAAVTDSGLVHKTGRGGRRFATGLAIGLGVLGVIAVTRARSHDYYDIEARDYEYSRRFERRCRRWRHRCLNGNDRACIRHDDRC